MENEIANTYRDRLGSNGKRGLKYYLLDLTNGKCAICAVVIDLDAPKNADNAFAMSHVIPACEFPGDQEKRPGWISGNLFAGCTKCNNETGKRNLTKAISLFRIPAGIGVWTDREVIALGRTIPTMRENASPVDSIWTEINKVI